MMCPGPKLSPNESRASYCCQVPGCTHALDGLYSRKRRICQQHQRAEFVRLCGHSEGACGCPEAFRFCLQCGKLQHLVEFEGAKRSCRDSLTKRRVRLHERAAVHDAAACCLELQQQQQQQPCFNGMDGCPLPASTPDVGLPGSWAQVGAPAALASPCFWQQPPLPKEQQLPLGSAPAAGTHTAPMARAELQQQQQQASASNNDEPFEAVLQSILAEELACTLTAGPPAPIVPQQLLLADAGCAAAQEAAGDSMECWSGSTSSSNRGAAAAGPMHGVAATAAPAAVGECWGASLASAVAAALLHPATSCCSGSGDTALASSLDDARPLGRLASLQSTCMAGMRLPMTAGGGGAAAAVAAAAAQQQAAGGCLAAAAAGAAKLQLLQTQLSMMQRQIAELQPYLRASRQQPPPQLCPADMQQQQQPQQYLLEQQMQLPQQPYLLCGMQPSQQPFMQYGMR